MPIDAPCTLSKNRRHPKNGVGEKRNRSNLVVAHSALLSCVLAAKYCVKSLSQVLSCLLIVLESPQLQTFHYLVDKTRLPMQQLD